MLVHCDHKKNLRIVIFDKNNPEHTQMLTSGEYQARFNLGGKLTRTDDDDFETTETINEILKELSKNKIENNDNNKAKAGEVVTDINSIKDEDSKDQNSDMQYVLYDNDTVIGYFKFYYTNGNCLSFFYTVMKEMRGKGYGSNMMEFILEQFQKIKKPQDKLYALIDCDNTPSIHIIEKYGGKCVFRGTMRGMYAALYYFDLED